MKLFEALKKLRVIEKKMQKNREKIQQYSSIVSNQLPDFESKDEQIREVSALLQSNVDLFNEYCSLKSRIEKTNVLTKVQIGDNTFSVCDLLVIKRKGANWMIDTYSSLNTNRADHQLRMSNKDAEVHAVKMYNEREKNSKLSYWQDLYDNIDSRLEMINWETDLLENE